MKRLFAILTICLSVSLVSCKSDMEETEKYDIEQRHFFENGKNYVTTEVVYYEHYDDGAFMNIGENIYLNTITFYSADSISYYVEEEKGVAEWFITKYAKQKEGIKK